MGAFSAPRDTSNKEWSGMNAFNRLKVGTQLVLGFVLVALIGAFIGVEGILKTGQMHDLADQMYTKETTGLRRASALGTAGRTRGLRLAGEPPFANGGFHAFEHVRDRGARIVA